MKLIAVRHGETFENVSGIIQGQRNGKLTEKGMAQVLKISRELKNEKIDFIYSSDLWRTAWTAEHIAAYHPIEVKYSPALREREFGIFQGKGREEFFDEEMKSGISRSKYRPKGGESFHDVMKRVKGFMDKTVKNHEGHNVVVVTHGGIIKSLLALYTRVPVEDIMGMKTRNTGILVMTIKQGKWSVTKNTAVFTKDDVPVNFGRSRKRRAKTSAAHRKAAVKGN